MFGRLAAVNSALNCRVTLRGSSGVPIELANTKPPSFQRPPAASPRLELADAMCSQRRIAFAGKAIVRRCASISAP
jgi:hypothetical protein